LEQLQTIGKNLLPCAIVFPQPAFDRKRAVPLPARFCKNALQTFAVSKKINAAALPPHFGRRAAEVDVDGGGMDALELLKGTGYSIITGQAELVDDRAFGGAFFCKGRGFDGFIAYGRG
jgi:hypothetical protein